MNKIFVFGVLLVLLFGCTEQEAPPEQPPIEPPPEQPPVEPEENITEEPVELEYPLKGVSLSTRGDEYFLQFFEEATEAGEVVMWAGDWNDLSDGAPVVVTEFPSTYDYDYIPLVEVTYYTQGEGELIRPFDESTRQGYKEDTIAFVEKYQPEYFVMGIETDIMYEKSPDDYEEFVVFYNEMYDEIKKVSPNTKVFTVFQLEGMKGCELWQEKSCNSSNSHWELIDDFKLDIVAFSTYPCLVYKDPSDIPEDHYTEISEHVSKPIAFTENGWHTEAYPPEWESSEEEQAEYITRFFELTKDLNVEVTVWSFMYGQGTIQPFNTMGLRRPDGTARPAWDEWVKGK